LAFWRHVERVGHSSEVAGEQVDDLPATLIGGQRARALVPWVCTDQGNRFLVDDGVLPTESLGRRFTIYPRKERLTAARRLH